MFQGVFMPKNITITLLASALGFCLAGCPASEAPPDGGGDGAVEGSSDGSDGKPLCERDDAEGTSCDDGDPCTLEDVCRDGACAGTPLACNTPPENVCETDEQLLTYAAEGTCSEGTCAYSSSRTVCDKGCRDGRCIESFHLKTGS